MSKAVKAGKTMPSYADDLRTTTSMVSVAAGGGTWCHPALVLFGLAVATTLVKRAYANLYNDQRAAITGQMLQETICVVICVPHDACALTKYTEKLFTYARWPQRLRIRIRKLVAEGRVQTVAIEDMLSEGRAVQGKHNSVKVEFRMRKTDDADELVRETLRLALDVHKKQDSKYTFILSHRPVDVVQDWDVRLVAMLRQCDEPNQKRGAILTCDPPANTQSLNPGASLPMARFLRLSSSETSIDSIDFANQPARPQPSLFCSALFYLARVGILGACQRLWTSCENTT